MENNNKKEGLFKRLSNAVQYTISGVKPGTWMGPNQPITPIAQEIAGRQMDFSVAANLQIQPKLYEGVSYTQLRALSENDSLVRLCIETRKDQITRFDYKFKLKDKTKSKDVVVDSRCKELEDFFLYPDKIHTHSEWMRMIIEDLLVIDAPAIYPVLTNGNKPFAFEVIDGSTIKRLIDDSGRTPIDGVSPAYQQVLKGLPAVDYTFNELVYKPRNIRSNKIYGYSQVEQIITTINLNLRKTHNQISYFTDGNVPNLIMKSPENWNPDQIRQFQRYWDELHTGINKHHGVFVPHGMDPYDTKTVEMKNEFDEWLARIIFYCFSLSPSALVKDSNKATANTNKELAEEEGLKPLMQWYKELIDLLIIKYFGYKDIEFVWDLEVQNDPLIQSQIDVSLVNAGIMTADEIRAERGLDPLPEPKEPVAVPGAPMVQADPSKGVQPGAAKPDGQKMFKKKSF